MQSPELTVPNERTDGRWVLSTHTQKRAGRRPCSREG
jgi:hypothetical protein